MIEGAALRRPDVIQDRPGRRSSRRFAGQAEALEREHAEMILKERNGVVGSKDPVIQRSLRPARARNASDRRRASVRVGTGDSPANSVARNSPVERSSAAKPT